MNSWEKNGQKFTKVFCLADKIHFLASEDSTSKDKPNKKEIIKEEKLENEEEDIDDIDDIPF